MNIRSRYIAVIVSAVLLLAGGLVPHYSHGAEVSDSRALEGLTEVRPIFDLNVATPSELLFYLQVIETTYDSLLAQGQKVDGIVAVRGGAVRLITSENWSFSEEDQKILEDAGQLIARLAGKGVRFEACSVALELFKVDPGTLLPGIQAVGNTFISLVGYQTKGYVIVPVK